MLKPLIEQFEKEYEITLDTKGDGVYSLRFTPELEILFSPIENGFSLHTVLARCPKQNEETLFQQMTIANLYGIMTHDAVLALNEEGTQVLLSQMIDYSITYKEFTEILEDFMNLAEFWREKTLSFAK